MNSNKRKIVVTGASGFLGSHLVERLKDDERYEVIALSSRPEALRERLGGVNIEYLHKDTLLGERAGSILPDSIVVNCAYPRASTGELIADGLKYIQSVFTSAVDNGASAIINISSQSVYSPRRTEAATEQTPVSLDSPYAVGKYAVELLLESLCRGSGTRFTSIRMASLIGPGFDQRIINRFVKQAMETGKLSVRRNRQRFGFFDIQDAVSGLITMLDFDPATWRTVYNLGGRGTSSLEEIAETVKAVLDREPPVEIVYLEDDGVSCSGINADAFYRDFGFAPGMDLLGSTREIYLSE